MYDFAPILDRMKGMNLDTLCPLGSIYDRGPGGLESQYRGFQDDFNSLAEDQKRLNMMTADSNQRFVDDVIGGGDRYADAIRGAKELQTGLTNRAFDELSQLEGIKRMENQERMGRFGDTPNSQLGAGQGIYDARMARAEDVKDAQFGAADRLRDAERLKAVLAADSVDRAANAQQRNLRSARVGQGTGTGMNMANAMIRAQAGADRSEAFGDAEIADAIRRGDSRDGVCRILQVERGVSRAQDFGASNIVI